MSTWCLIKSEADKVRKALKDGSIDPNKLAGMTSAERNAFLSKFVGQENATYVNSLFESKLLLKNQKAGMISWAKKVVGINPSAKRDILSKIERLDKVLDPKEGEQFLHDLVTTRLGVDVTQEEAQHISDLSKSLPESEKLADKDGVFPTEKDRLTYGANKVAIENYINDIKIQNKQTSFKQEPFKKTVEMATSLPGDAKSVQSSLDNSYFGRQGIKVLEDPTTSGIWIRNFAKSFGDIGRQLFAKGKFYTSGNDAVMDAIKADIYSRPNAVNGKYTAGGYGLDVLSEEAYPSKLPEKIPLLGRLFKASEAAYNGGALRMRADLADKYIKIAESQGINTLVSSEARPIGNMISSFTGRGSLGKADVLAKEANVLFYSVKFLKSNIDTLTALPKYVGGKIGQKLGVSGKWTPGEEFARKQSAARALRVIATLASILGLAKLLDPDSVDEDPRSTNFGKIKIFGHWVDISGGFLPLVVLASRLVPTKHNGEWGLWMKSNSGKWTNLSEGKYGQQNGMDLINNFVEGKAAPAAGLIRDLWTGENFQGQKVTIKEALKTAFTPFIVQNYNQLKNDPNSSFILGSMILEALGLSASSSIIPNSSSKIIPEGSTVNNGDIISYVNTYAKALGTDPETAFNRIFTGQKITRVTNGTVIVERMPVAGSQAVKTKLGGNNPQMKLDHTIPLELGGSNDESNLKLVTTSQWSSYTSVENALGKALKDKKVDKKTAQQLITDFKNGKMTKDQVLAKLK